MAKRKKSSVGWKIVKLLLKGIWLAVFYAVKGIFSLTKGIYTLIRGGIKKQKIIRNQIYQKKAQFDPLNVIKTISGSYELLEKRLFEDSVIALLFGKRGSGKSALGFKILENVHSKTKRGCFVLGASEGLMPSWIKSIESIEAVPNESIVLVDEGAVSFGSRESMNKSNIGLTKLMAIARHKNLSIIFITQNTGMIDRNVLKLADILMVKEGSLLQLEMERPEIKKFYEKSNDAFSNLDGERRQYVYVIDSDFEGVLSHKLPSFWSIGLSKNQA